MTTLTSSNGHVLNALHARPFQQEHRPYWNHSDVASNCCHSATLKVSALDQQLKLSLQKQCQTCNDQHFDLGIMEFVTQSANHG